MSLSRGWRLLDKNGNEPSAEDRNCIEKLPRHLLFPCSQTVDQLEMPTKATPPREMNQFMVFRRQLAHVARSFGLSDDGKNLSRFASYIWRGASLNEKKSYAEIALQLKQRHYQRYPFITPPQINANLFPQGTVSPMSLTQPPPTQEEYIPVSALTAPVNTVNNSNDTLVQSVTNVPNVENVENVNNNNLVYYILPEYYTPNPCYQDYIDMTDNNVCFQNNYPNNYEEIPIQQPYITWYQNLNNGDCSAGISFDISSDTLALERPYDELAKGFNNNFSGNDI